MARKSRANASPGANRKGATLRKLATEMITDAAATDAAEDQAEAQRGGPADRPSPQWRDRSGRKERIKQAIEELDTQVSQRNAPVRRAQQRLADVEARRDELIAARQAKQAARDECRARHGRGKPGAELVADPVQLQRLNQTVDNRRRFLDEIAQRAARAAGDVRVNLTDPDSRPMTTRAGWIQGYNCHLGVSQDGIILAASATNHPVDVEEFEPTLRQTQQAVQQMNQATGHHDQIGIVLDDAGYFSEGNLSAQGPDRLIAAGKRRDIANTQTGPGKAQGAANKPYGRDMIQRLRDPANAELYKRRGAIVEPKNAHLKDRRNLRQFARRGLKAIDAELKFAAMATNPLAIYTARTTG